MSGYWVPSMIDTATHKPIAPRELLVYYKTGLYAYMNDNSVHAAGAEGTEDDRRQFRGTAVPAASARSSA